jgi:hypothetical protein
MACVVTAIPIACLMAGLARTASILPSRISMESIRDVRAARSATPSPIRGGACFFTIEGIIIDFMFDDSRKKADRPKIPFERPAALDAEDAGQWPG